MNRGYKRRDFFNAKKLSFFTKKSYLKKKHNLKLFLKFGNSAIVNEQPVILSNNFLLKFILLLKRVVRKKGKSFKFFFFQPITLFKVSKQSKGARMGKGKGKSIMLIQRLAPYKPLVEFNGLRFKRLFYINSFFSNRFSTNLFLFLGNFLSLYAPIVNSRFKKGHFGNLLTAPLNV